MAAYTSVLVLLALCIASALSLQCYHCSFANSNANCMTSTICSANQTFCMTTVTYVSFGGSSSITKECAASCKAGSSSISIISIQTSCCTTDLCNVSGASSIKSTYTSLAVALGFLGAVLRQSV